MKKVFITRRIPGIAATLLGEAFDVEQNSSNEPLPHSELCRIVGEYDAILSTVVDVFDKSMLREGGRLRAVSNYGIGLDNIDLEAARCAGISIYNTPDVVTNSTADLTFGILLSLIRQISSADTFVRAGAWRAWDPEVFVGEELFGKKLGIWGFGRTGQAVARRAIGFGLDVIYNRRGRTPVDPALLNVTRAVSLEELLGESDYISVHLPLTDETRGIINANAFAGMRRHPILINMARGSILVTDDLVHALESGAIRGCGLDVASPEPLPANHPLYGRRDVLLTPHIGTATRECRDAMAVRAARNILNHFL